MVLLPHRVLPRARGAGGRAGHRLQAVIPTGEGVLAFATEDEAVAAIERVAADAEGHSRAAREIAHEYFDSARVLSDLLEEALA